MDEAAINSYLDRLNFKFQGGGDITEQEFLNAQRAKRRDFSKEVSSAPVDPRLDAAERERSTLMAGARHDASRQFMADSRAIDSERIRQIEQAQTSGRKVQQAQQSVLSFS